MKKTKFGIVVLSNTYGKNVLALKEGPRSTFMDNAKVSCWILDQLLPTRKTLIAFTTRCWMIGDWQRTEPNSRCYKHMQWERREYSAQWTGLDEGFCLVGATFSDTWSKAYQLITSRENLILLQADPTEILEHFLSQEECYVDYFVSETKK